MHAENEEFKRKEKGRDVDKENWINLLEEDNYTEFSEENKENTNRYIERYM